MVGRGWVAPLRADGASIPNCTANFNLVLTRVMPLEYCTSGALMRAAANSRSIKPPRKSAEKFAFDAQAFLDSTGVALKIVEFETKQTIFSQGDPCKSVIYIQQGSVKVSVVSPAGKEAVVAILGPGDFLGEGALASQPLRMATATAVMPATVLEINKKEMFRVLHAEHALSDRFITYMLKRNIRTEVT
jgi:CRP/FNR family transcriptional regulator, cyclic AMP receptor protein